ncbi:MAG: ABC transporter permease [Anaerolineaceae bacterium]|nr:ABC transporter permease [Anaerolineae bacterium]MCB9460659.1 ABC transporter permease [Anaerolineaceae bacterium]
MRRTITILVLPALLFIFIFFVLPLLFLLAQSFQDPETGQLTLAGYAEFFQKETSQIIYVRTLRLGLTITLINIVLAYPASYVLARLPAKRRTLAMSLVILPLMTNPVARTYAWLIILGRTGLINNVLLSTGLIESPERLIYTEGAIILGLTQLLLPLMILSLVSAMENIPKDVEEAARSLGANGITTFLRVIVPLSADGLVLGATLVFTGSITAYVTPVILGGNRMLMLSTLLRQRAMMAFDEQGATVVAVVMIVTALAVNLLVRMLRPKPTAQR